jgi:hypothetical protein
VFPTPACTDISSPSPRPSGLYALTLTAGSGNAAGWGTTSGDNGVRIYQGVGVTLGSVVFQWPGLSAGESSSFAWVCLSNVAPNNCYTLVANISSAAQSLGAAWELLDRASPRVPHPTQVGSLMDEFCLEDGVFKNSPTTQPTTSPVPTALPIPVPTPHPSSPPTPSPSDEPTAVPTASPSPKPTPEVRKS